MGEVVGEQRVFVVLLHFEVGLRSFEVVAKPRNEFSTAPATQ